MLPIAVLAGGPSLWPGRRRVGDLLRIDPALAALVVGGIAFLIGSIGLLCSSDDSHRYLSTLGGWVAVAAFALPYALGSAWAVRGARRVLVAWPLVILCAIALGSVALLLLEGGVHHCQT